MGAEVQAQSYTREERQRYREKVRQNLDVFEKMLNTSFEFDRPMTGLEIELNLVDGGMQPHFHNAEVLAAIADEDYQTELAQYNIELNVPPATARRLRPRARGGAARGLNRADRAAKVGSKIVAIGILPTIMPSTTRATGSAATTATRHSTTRSSSPAARTSTSTSKVPPGRWRRTATRSRRSPPAPRCGCTPPGRPVGVRGPLERRPGALGPRSPGGELTVLLRQAAARDAHRALQAGHRHPADRAEEPGRAAPRCSSASAGSPRSSTCSRRTSGTSRPSSPRRATRTR